MLRYDTLLDLARQRLRTIASSPNFTRPARHQALAMQRLVQAELDNVNAGCPDYALVRFVSVAKPCNDNAAEAKEVG